jgi:hypothetical protein
LLKDLGSTDVSLCHVDSLPDCSSDEGGQVLTSGYQLIWETIAKQDLLDIKLGVHVKSIDRNLKGDRKSPIVISGTNSDGDEFKMECDFLIIACDYKQFSEVFSDTTDEEAELFNSYGTKGLVQSIMELPLTVNPKEQRCVQFYADVLSPDQEGKIFSIRNPKKMFLLDDSKDTHRTVLACQLYNKAVPSDRLGEVTAAAMAHLKELGVNTDEVKVLKQCTWDYFPHFSLVGRSSPCANTGTGGHSKDVTLENVGKAREQSHVVYWSHCEL